MSNLQKKLAAKILKVGESKVWLDPTKTKDIKQAITRIDVKKLIKRGWIKVSREKISYPEKVQKKKRGQGRRKGGKYAVVSSKRKWISTVRPLRRFLKELKQTQQIDQQTYKKTYKLIKGGVFRSRAHMHIYLEQRGLLKKK